VCGVSITNAACAQREPDRARGVARRAAYSRAALGWFLRTAVATLLVVAAAVVGAVALDSPSPAKSASRALSTSMWSARRLPAFLTSPADPPRLTAALTPSVQGHGDACFAVVGDSAYHAGYHDDVPLLPASTQKLMTAAAAVSVLGQDHTFTTAVVADGDPASGSVPRLWIVGGGDPVVATAPYAEPVSTPLESLADAVVAAGVREVTGGIAGDDSRYADAWFLGVWPPSYHDHFESGPVSALTVNDGIPLVRGRPVIVDDPAAYTASELTRLLAARGVRVGGTPAHETAPGGTHSVASVTSKPLRDIVTAMLVTSDNLTAELLTREVGLARSGQGTTAAGTAAIVAELQRLFVPVGGVTMQDGSGLSRGNRTTCRTLVGVLALAALPGFDVLSSGLPTVNGNVRAKGGYLDDVSGLAGFATYTRPVRFALLLNGNVPRAPGPDLQRFLDALTAAPAPLSPDLVPGPVAPRRTPASG
jgi:serine-type D-Ala-D-Ala carboxypeptidase/endopeptidase (penicillin-binding protein 4)